MNQHVFMALLSSLYFVSGIQYEGFAIQIMVTMTLSDYYLVINDTTSIKFLKDNCDIKNNKLGIWNIDDTNKCVSVEFDNNLKIESANNYERQRKVLAVKYNINNLNNDFTEQEIKSVIWTDANGYFTDLSRGRLSISPTITYFEINTRQINYQECPYVDWYMDTRNTLLKQGVFINKFHHIVLFIAPEINCGAGVAAVGRTNTILPIWIMSHTKTVVFHEFGHSFGLNHARLDMNHDLRIDENGEYGDIGDIMGYSTEKTPSFNGPHYVNLEWIDKSEIFNIESSIYNKNITIIIDSLSRLYSGLTTAPVVITFQINNRTYYISYRTQTPRDQLFQAYENKLTIHYQWTDTTWTYLVGLIDENQSYNDKNNKIKFSLESKNKTHAIVVLNLDYKNFGHKITSSYCHIIIVLLVFIYHWIG
jgi:hypothetical protein